MRYKLLVFPTLLLLSLAACSYGYNDKIIMYENTFSPWITHDSEIDTSKSFFACAYDSTYEYSLFFKNGKCVVYHGNYNYSDECFYLYADGAIVSTLIKLNYYEYYEVFNFEGIDYNVVWHAHHIFN